MGIVLQHLLRDVPVDVPDGFVTRTALGMIGTQRVPVIVTPPLHVRFRLYGLP